MDPEDPLMSTVTARSGVALAQIHSRLVRERVWPADHRSADPEHYGVRRLADKCRELGISVGRGWGGDATISDAAAQQLYGHCVQVVEADRAFAERTELLALQARDTPPMPCTSPGETAAILGDSYLAVVPLLVSEVQARRQMAGLPPVQPPEPQRTLSVRQKRLLAEELEALDER